MGFLAPQINQAMLERERGVVQNEKRQGENQPYGRVFDRIVERMYPVVASVQLVRRSAAWRTSNAATLQDVKEWYATYYGPNNCVLSLAGDITRRARAGAGEEVLRRHPAGPAAGTRSSSGCRGSTRNMRDQMQDRVPQARIYRVYHAPAWRDADIAAAASCLRAC